MDEKSKGRWLMYAILVFAVGVGVILFLMRGWARQYFSRTPDQHDTERSHASQTPDPAPPAGPAIPEVEHWVYAKKSEQDPGTIRVYLRNAGNAPMRIRRVLLDELPIPVWGVDLDLDTVKPEGILADSDADHADVPESTALRFSGKRIVWARLAPATVVPGQTAEFAAKLSNPMKRPMKVEFLPETGEENLSLVVRPLQPRLVVTAVTFSSGYGRVYTYLENRAGEPIEISDIRLNGLSVKSRSWWGTEAFAHGEKRLIVTRLANPLQQGDFITLKVATTGDIQAMERVRVFNGFPVNVERGGNFAGLGENTPAYIKSPNYFGTPFTSLSAPDNVPEPSLAANYIFACAMHEYGCNHERCARETLRRYGLCRRFDPNHPCFIHLCRIRPETGYALFAETADILRINSNITSIFSTRREDEPSEEIVERLTRYAVNVAGPRPVHAIADTSPIDGKGDALATISDFRRRTWTILGCGVKGLFYRHGGPDSPRGEELSHEIEQTNQVIEQLREYLAIAAPVDWAATADDRFSAHTLLAGDRALVIFLVRHDHPDEDETFDPIPIHVRIPPWLSVDTGSREGAGSCASEVGPTGMTSIPAERHADGSVTLTIAPPVDATAILLETEKGQP